MKTFDFRGLSCPQPVIKTKKEIDKNPGLDQFNIIVDNSAAMENLTRFLKHQGFNSEAENENGDYLISVIRTGEEFETEDAKKISGQKNTLVMVTGNCIGGGSPELGSKLMINFLKTLGEMKESLWRLVFINEGVKLTVKDSNVITDLKALEDAGISILVCGTCLDYYSLLEDKQVGETTNMLDIMTSLQVSEKVINI